MSILVDTSVWSLALRKKTTSEQEQQLIKTFVNLITQDKVVIIGAIRQEILSGIRLQKQFNNLKSKLSYFHDITLKRSDYETAADCFNQYRQKGIQGSHIDFLICAVALNHDLPIFTLDKDFTHYQKILPIQLYQPT